MKSNQFSELLLVSVTAVCLLTLTVMSPAFAQSSDPGAIGEIFEESPPGQKISSGIANDDFEPGQELKNVAPQCISDLAGGSSNCSDDDE